MLMPEILTRLVPSVSVKRSTALRVATSKISTFSAYGSSVYSRVRSMDSTIWYGVPILTFIVSMTFMFFSSSTRIPSV
jgi:hypothetical protein